MKRRSFALVLTTLMLFGCSNNPGINPSPTGPNPSSVLVTVLVGGTAASGITVMLSTKLNGALPVSGTILASAVTDPNGHVTFNDLPKTGQLCLSATQSAPGYPAAVGTCSPQPVPSTATLSFQASS